jgi:hypothetical protein
MTRRLIVTADDFGIGPATSRGILDLAAAGVVTSTVLLVNSPHAAEGVRLWEQAGGPLELGWHPCLTMDAPVLPPERVPSLVGANGRFQPLPRVGRAPARGGERPPSRSHLPTGRRRTDAGAGRAAREAVSAAGDGTVADAPPGAGGAGEAVGAVGTR